MEDKKPEQAAEWPWLTRAKWFVGVSWVVLFFVPLLALNCNPIAGRPQKVIDQVQQVLTQLGTFGDMFGALNCLFSGLALIGVAYAVKYQRQELSNQEKEIDRNAHVSALQTKLAAYQSLADHHRHNSATAMQDDLFRHRSAGRAAAYAELMENILRAIEFTSAGQKAEETAPSLGHHCTRIRILYMRYMQSIADLEKNLGGNIESIRSLVVQLSKSVASIDILTERQKSLDNLLEECQSSMNIMCSDYMWSFYGVKPEDEVAYQLEMARDAFEKAREIVNVIHPNEAQATAS